MALKNGCKGMTQFCLDAERWSAAAGSIYTAPKGKMKFVVEKHYSSKYISGCSKSNSLSDKIFGREKNVLHNFKIPQVVGCSCKILYRTIITCNQLLIETRSCILFLSIKFYIF